MERAQSLSQQVRLATSTLTAPPPEASLARAHQRASAFLGRAAQPARGPNMSTIWRKLKLK